MVRFFCHPRSPSPLINFLAPSIQTRSSSTWIPLDFFCVSGWFQIYYSFYFLFLPQICCTDIHGKPSIYSFLSIFSQAARWHNFRLHLFASFFKASRHFSCLKANTLPFICFVLSTSGYCLSFLLTVIHLMLFLTLQLFNYWVYDFFNFKLQIHFRQLKFSVWNSNLPSVRNWNKAPNIPIDSSSTFCIIFLGLLCCFFFCYLFFWYVECYSDTV